MMSRNKVNPTVIFIETPVPLLVFLNAAQLEAGPRELLRTEQVWRLEGEMGFHKGPRWWLRSVTAAFGLLLSQCQAV